jgi:outer membrane lipoprotein-sorting protein
MYRAMVATAVFVALFLGGVRVQAGGETLLEKKDSLKEDDKGYKPGTGTEKIDVPFAAEIFKRITDTPHKVYKLKLKKGDKVVIEMHSKDMDSVVVVEDSKMTVLGLNDDDPDGGGTLDSRLVWTAPADDEYRIIATNLDKKKAGDFTLKVSKAK